MSRSKIYFSSHTAVVIPDAINFKRSRSSLLKQLFDGFSQISTLTWTSCPKNRSNNFQPIGAKSWHSWTRSSTCPRRYRTSRPVSVPSSRAWISRRLQTKTEPPARLLGGSFHQTCWMSRAWWRGWTCLQVSIRGNGGQGQSCQPVRIFRISYGKLS